MKKVLAALLFFLIGIQGIAQNILEGEVVDSATSVALPFCLVQTGKTTLMTDGQGYFALELPTDGELILIFHYLGKDYSYELVVSNDTSVVFRIAIPPEEIDAIEIHAHEHKAEEVVALKIPLSKYELERKGAITLGDALQGVKGVALLKTGGNIAKPVLQGMHSNRILVVNSGSRLENQQWGAEHAPGLDPLNGGSIEVLKGASTLLYGNDAIGGVVRILPGSFQETDYAQVKMFSRVQSNPVGAQLGLQFEKFDSNLQWGNRLTLNMRKAGDIYSPNYVLSNTGHSQASVNYFSHLHIGESSISVNMSSFNQLLGILEASHIGNQSDLNRALASDTPLIVRPYSFSLRAPYQEVHHHSGQILWERTHLPIGDLRASFTQQINQRKEFDKHGGAEEAALELNLLTSQLNLLLDKHIEDWRIEYGAVGERQQNTFEGRYFIPNYLRYKMGLFGVTTYKHNKTLMELGLRYDQMNNNTYRYVSGELVNEQFNYGGWSASLGLKRPLGDNYRFNIGLSRKFRAPEVNELFSNGLHHGSAALEFGDIGLKEEIVYSFNSALSYQARKWSWFAEPFVHYFDGFINLEPTNETQLSIRGAFPVFEYVQSAVIYSGADVGLNYAPDDNWQISSQLNLVYAESLDNLTFVYGVPAPAVQLNTKHIFNPESSLANCYAVVMSKYVFRHTWAEIAQDFAPPPDHYLLVGLEFGKHFSKTPGILVFQINNLLNHNYRDYMNRYRYFANEQGIQFNLTFNYTLITTRK